MVNSCAFSFPNLFPSFTFVIKEIKKKETIDNTKKYLLAEKQGNETYLVLDTWYAHSGEARFFFFFYFFFFSSIFLMLDSFPSKRTVFFIIIISSSTLSSFFCIFRFFGFLFIFFSFSCTKVLSAFFRKIFLKRDPTPENRVRVRSEAIQI